MTGVKQTEAVDGKPVAAHLRSFFEKVGSLPRVFIVYICAHTFPRYTLRLRSLYFIGSQAISFRSSDGFIEG